MLSFRDYLKEVASSHTAFMSKALSGAKKFNASIARPKSTSTSKPSTSVSVTSKTTVAKGG